MASATVTGSDISYIETSQVAITPSQLLIRVRTVVDTTNSHSNNSFWTRAPNSPSSTPAINFSPDSSSQNLFAVESGFTSPDRVLWDDRVYGNTLDLNDSISGSMVFNNRMLSDFNLPNTPSTYPLMVPASNPSDLGNSIVLRVLPEPSSSVLSGLGLLFLVAQRKR